MAARFCALRFNHLGVDVSLGNIAPEEILPLETLRLGLRADTAALGVRR